MTALATVEQVAARLGRSVSDEERSRITAFLTDVSALVTDVCGTDFLFHQDQAVYLDVTDGPELPLPRFMRPVQSVTKVQWADGTPVDAWAYSKGALWRRPGWQHGPHYSPQIAVTATYGYTAVPDVVTAVVCAEVVRWLAVQPGVSAERVGDLEVTYGATAPTQGLSPAAHQGLRRYRRTVASRDVWRPIAL